MMNEIVENDVFDAADQAWMQMALSLALRGQGQVEPNPMVGCVIVQREQVIGQGWHRRYGEAHAEINALQSCRVSTEGSTVYVTLEPCCHQGKTGPCSQALIEAQVARVVIACRDPFGQVDGKGIDDLRNAGIQVDLGCCEEQAKQVIAPFVKRVTKKQPWVVAKWAMTLDGKIATRTGDSRWISNESSRKLVHQLRMRMDAILVGSNTVAADDPSLTARVGDEIKKTPLRVTIDRELKIDPKSQLVQTASEIPTMIFAGRLANHDKKSELENAGVEVFLSSDPSPWNHLDELFHRLYEKGVTNLLVEGGGQTLGTFFDQRKIDEFHIFVAPIVCGGEQAVSPVLGKGMPTISHCLQLARLKTELIENNVYLSGFAK